MAHIVIAEDHAMIREGLKSLLAHVPGLAIVGETGNGAEVEALLYRTHADLLLLDLDLPGCHGIALTARVKEQRPNLKVLILTASTDHACMTQAFASGADGYLLKHEDSSELLDAIPAVLGNQRYVSKLLAPIAECPAQNDQFITPREQQILKLIAAGQSTQEIADRLALSILTVRKHRQNLMTKLSLHNAVELTHYAIRQGIV